MTFEEHHEQHASQDSTWTEAANGLDKAAHNVETASDKVIKILKIMGFLMFVKLVTIIGLAVLIQNLGHSNDDTQASNDRLREEQECRFDIASKVESLSDEIDITTADLIVAAVNRNQAEVERLTAVLDQQTDQLPPAIEERNAAVETCANE